MEARSLDTGRAAPTTPTRAAPAAEPRAAPTVETPTQRLDRLTHTAFASATGGLSPISLALAWADWAWHLGASPGRQMELAARAAQAVGDTWRAVLGSPVEEPAGDADDDPRFRHPDWAQWPFSALRAGFRNAETFWRDAARVPGMTAHHADMTAFFARQWLGLMAPANGLATNPVVLRDAAASGGGHLLQGTMNWLRDLGHQPDPLPAEGPPPPRFEVGRDVAVTPGQVVFRNRLIELLRYDPQTPTVLAQPLLVVPSWIMKYYILDLSPHNSMVRWLVGQGHTVYMVSWRNPDADDRELAMDDYLRLGVFDALQAVGRLHPGAGPARGRRSTPVHAMGYCLGGTLLAIAAARLGRLGVLDALQAVGRLHPGPARGRRGTPVHAMGYCLGGTLLAIAAARLGRLEAEGAAAEQQLPPLASVTLLAAQTDFSEPGELGLFIDESQLDWLDEVTRSQGYLSGAQMAGSFQFLHSRDLVWTRRMREYLMGERERRSDLMAWNADTTRLPARMHHQYLSALYLHNALANGSWRVDGQAVSLRDIRQPLFVVGTERDHVSPWRSVYKLHRLCDAELTFVLTAGGHNAGIVSEPGHARRSYRIARREARGAWVDPEAWLLAAERHEGSWWPAWQQWLAGRSGPRVKPRALPAACRLGPAPGTYVMQRWDD